MGFNSGFKGLKYQSKVVLGQSTKSYGGVENSPLFLHLGSGLGDSAEVNTPVALYPRRNMPLPIVQVAWRAPGPL